MVLLTLIVLVLITLTLIHFYFTSKESYKFAIEFPGPEPLPIIGNAHLAVGKTSQEIMEKALELSVLYGHVSRGFLGYKVLIFLSNPQDIEIILNSHLTKSTEYRFFKPWLGDGLLISNGEKWRSHRKLIAPAFHQIVLKNFISTFNRNSWRLVERLQNEIGKEFDVHDYMSEVTVDILLETAMGHSRTKSDREGYEYAKAVMDMCDIIHKRQSVFYLRSDFIFNLLNIKKEHDRYLNIIHGLTDRVFKSKKEEMKLNSTHKKSVYIDIMETNEKDAIENQQNTKNQYQSINEMSVDDTDETIAGEKNRLPFLDLMIESTYYGANISDAEIKEEVDTIMFEGHDTTAACASFVLCLLACYPDIQQRVYEEQLSIFGSSKRSALFSDISQMYYLERVILETLRLYPPVPMIAREVTENVRIVSEPLTIPAGATVLISPYRVNRQEDIYPNPNQFNPDNFLPEKTRDRNYYGFIPFSAGPRSCVGRKYAMLKLKVLLSTVFRNFIVYSKYKESDFKLQGDIILKRSDGFRIQIKQR